MLIGRLPVFSFAAVFPMKPARRRIPVSLIASRGHVLTGRLGVFSFTAMFLMKPTRRRIPVSLIAAGTLYFFVFVRDLLAMGAALILTIGLRSAGNGSTYGEH